MNFLVPGNFPDFSEKSLFHGHSLSWGVPLRGPPLRGPPYKAPVGGLLARCVVSTGGLIPCAPADLPSWARLGLGFGWLLLGFRLDFGSISGGSRLRLDLA